MPVHPTLSPGHPSLPALVPIGARQGGKPIPVTRPFILIGSRNRAHLHLVSKAISRKHACLIRSEHGHYLRDLASRTGILVNGTRAKETELRDGDHVEIGAFRFTYTCPAKPADTILSAPAQISAALCIDSGPSTSLDATVLIGRGGRSDISLTGTAVSKSHALVFQLDGRHHIRDLGSRTGTLLNGKPVRQQILEFGDEIKVAETILRYLPLASEQPALPEADSAALPAPPEWKVTTAVADESQAPLQPLPWADPNGLGVGIFPSGRESEQHIQTDSDPQGEGEECQDDSGLVPWRGDNGRPIYVKMHVPDSYAWFPAMADIIGRFEPDRPAAQDLS